VTISAAVSALLWHLFDSKSDEEEEGEEEEGEYD